MQIGLSQEKTISISTKGNGDKIKRCHLSLKIKVFNLELFIYIWSFQLLVENFLLHDFGYFGLGVGFFEGARN